MRASSVFFNNTLARRETNRSFDPSILRSFDPSILRSFDPSILRSFDPSILRSGTPALRLLFERWLSEDHEAALAVAAKMTTWNRRSFLRAIIWNKIPTKLTQTYNQRKTCLKSLAVKCPNQTSFPSGQCKNWCYPSSFLPAYLRVTPNTITTLFSRALTKSDPLALLQITDESQRHETGLAQDDTSNCHAVAARASMSQEPESARGLRKTKTSPQTIS
jgi:hypothetical protein